MIRVEIPFHLRTLAGVDGEVELTVDGEVTRASILDALETRYPMLRGTIRDHVTQRQRPLVRFLFVQGRHHPRSADGPLPDAVASGRSPFSIVGSDRGRISARESRSSGRPWRQNAIGLGPTTGLVSVPMPSMAQ